MSVTYDDFRTLKVEKPEPRIGLLTFNRPEKRNSISPEFSREMNIVLDRIAGDDEIRTVVLTGAGSAFCAGMDLKVFYEYRDRMGEFEEPGLGAMDWFSKLRELPKPTIAAVNGHTYGGGFLVVANCDMAVAAEDAKFGLSEINWGGPPGGGATRAALDTVSVKAANYLLYTGNPIDGREAERIGFVNKAVPADRLLEEAMVIARAVAPHHPTALKWLKLQIHGSLTIPDFYRGVEYEGMILSHMEVADGYTGHHEGWKQFAEKTYKPGIESLDYSDDPSGRTAKGRR